MVVVVVHRDDHPGVVGAAAAAAAVAARHSQHVGRTCLPNGINGFIKERKKLEK